MSEVEKCIQDEEQYTVVKHTVDNITYTVKSRSSPNATQTLQSKLDASIRRDMARLREE